MTGVVRKDLNSKNICALLAISARVYATVTLKKFLRIQFLGLVFKDIFATSKVHN